MSQPSEHNAVEPFNVLPVADIPPEALDQPPWLVDQLWAHEAVGIIGGAPKCCKTYLALEIALAVASGRPCLGRFHVPQPGPVLLFAAEDSPLQLRARLIGLARARNADFKSLPVFLILAQQLRLDLGLDRQRLSQAIEKYQPRLLILDPFVRLHRLDENSAMEVSALLADLRTFQRRFHLAILLVHHTRKGNGEASGQTLRGSSDLHAWGDSNLYLRRSSDQIHLTVEHRAARAPETIALTLTADEAPHLEVTGLAPAPKKEAGPDLQQEVLDALRRHHAALTQEQLRRALKVRNQALTVALRELLAQNKISRCDGGWTIAR
jgi:hypothetical protein